MKKIVLLITFIMFSCTQKNDEYYLYSFFENSELSVITYDRSYMKWGKIRKGKNLVFEYEYSAEEKANTEDDEYSEYIRFEIDSKLTKFSFKDKELEEIKATFSKSCDCNFSYDSNKDVSPTGTIKGEKISDNQWNILIDATFYGNDYKRISGNFKLKN